MDNPSMKLNELLDQYQNIEDDREKVKQQRNVILCIDQALREVHDSGYIVDSFDPRDITIYPHKVVFESMSQMNGNDELMIKKNIMDSALLSIRIYLNYFDDMELIQEQAKRFAEK